MPQVLSRYRQKKMVRPLNMSYEYTQYLLKNIQELGQLRPEVIHFGHLGQKKVEKGKKNRSTISEL